MNEKITFPRLATLLADKSGRSKRFSEDFLREFFALISERLEAGESVKIKGLGTFRLTRVEPRRSVDVTTGQPMEISGHSKVVFIPSKELAEAVNAPFEAFTAIEISDDADLSQIFTKDEIALQQEGDDLEEDVYTEQAYGMPTSEAVRPDDSLEELDNKQEVTTENKSTIHGKEAIEVEGSAEVEESEGEEIKEEETTEETEETEDDQEEAVEEDGANREEEDYEASASRSSRWKKTLLISLGAAMFALIATFAVWYVFATNDFNGLFNRKATATSEEEGFVVGSKATAPSLPSAIDSAITDSTPTCMEGYAESVEEPEVPTAPSDPIVYDTISTTRYLTTMAKGHYGNYNLWPFIYEENKAILGHPDRIRPGTPVVIPKLSKYGVDPNNTSDIEKAKKMGVEIYARYGKKI